MIGSLFYRRRSFVVISDAAFGIWRGLQWISRERALVIILISLLAFAGSSMVSVLSGGPPKPAIFDEFSYLLAADTFAGGRLTNPTPPMWEHFESFGILYKPTYMSGYPPGQGLILALGQVLFGHPIFGVWLSASLMCGAICWMLYGWLPSKWAVIGGVISVLNIGCTTYWSQSYWGGAFAAFGGALVFGAFKRIIFRLRLRDALLMAFGLGILANTRPFEGLLITIPIIFVLISWVLGIKRPPIIKILQRFIMPCFFASVVIIFWLGIYNKAITGDPLKIPQLEYVKQESSVPIFRWQPHRPEVSYRYKEMEYREQKYLKVMARERKSLKRTVKICMQTFRADWNFYIGFILTIPFILGLLLAIQCRWVQFAILCVFMIGFIEPAMLLFDALIHYSAPIACLYIYLAAQGLRSLYLLQRLYKPAGILSVLLVLILSFVSVGATIADKVAINIASKRSLQTKENAHKEWNVRRYEIIERLKKEGGRHLIIVRYGEKHNVSHEWVWNDADIDKAIVIWARDRDAAENRKLADCFNDRKIWLLEINDGYSSYPLISYPIAAQTGDPKRQ